MKPFSIVQSETGHPPIALLYLVTVSKAYPHNSQLALKLGINGVERPSGRTQRVAVEIKSDFLTSLEITHLYP